MSLNLEYKPKFYNCNNVELKEINNKTIFIFDNEHFIKVDESIELIKSKMKDVLFNKIDVIYFSNGMMNVDIDRTIDNKWMLFDEFDFYIFEMDV